MAGAYFHLAFFELVASFISDRHWAGEADSHLHLPGRLQLQVSSSHDDNAANISPLIIFAQYSILQVKKEGRTSNT